MATQYNTNTNYYNPSSSSSSLTATYWITVGGRSIYTTVTSDPLVVDRWVGDVTARTYRKGLVVGLDCEWRPSFTKGRTNKVGLIQLCVGSKCLTVQLLYTTNRHCGLLSFLLDPTINFVGVGIDGDARKLVYDHGIRVGGRRYDLAELAASRLHRKELRKQGLKGLAREILGIDMLKPKTITLSNWSAMYLSDEQIEYACIDAYVSFSIGMKLLGRWR
uniref:3'-5' exonuclease domain-containing protein n=2 Tax=Nymphaea colorata TaxID=210225 RepID=A0A5K1DS10_9MAGN